MSEGSARTGSRKRRGVIRLLRGDRKFKPDVRCASLSLRTCRSTSAIPQVPGRVVATRIRTACSDSTTRKGWDRFELVGVTRYALILRLLACGSSRQGSFAVSWLQHNDSEMWYVPLLMLYGGLRLEEAAQLRPQDIREQDGVWVIDVNEVAGALKTENGARLVPLHRAIRDSVAGFARKATGENVWGLSEDATGRYSGAPVEIPQPPHRHQCHRRQAVQRVLLAANPCDSAEIRRRPRVRD
jgi:integrase